MIPQINHHPSAQLIEQFHRGVLSPGISVAISAHLELCECCEKQTACVIDQVATEWNGTPQATEKTTQTPAFDDLLSSILSQPQQINHATKKVTSGKIHLLGHSVSVPEILAKVAGEQLHWKKLPGGINHAQMALDKNAQCEFLYVKPGGQIPQHKHQGTEITLVLDGCFNDAAGEYQPGDFIVRTRDDSHTVSTDEGCLCFTVLDRPVLFTTGLARLFNPINQYLFNRAMR